MGRRQHISSVGRMRNGSNRRRWTIFSFAWELWLITTQSTLILLDLEYNLYNDYYSVNHHPRCFQFGRGTDFPLQGSAKRGNWKRQGYPRPSPLICGSARDEKIVNKIINIEENKLMILLTFTMTDACITRGTVVGGEARISRVRFFHCI